VIGDGLAPDQARRPALTRLTLADFRNYASATLALDGRHVVLTGANGAGKTNLLEAVSFLAPGRGLRRPRLDAVLRQTVVGSALPATGGWAIGARLQMADAAVEIATGTGGDRHGDRRQVRLDGVTQPSQSALGHLAPLMWLTPAMDRLFLEGAEPRRRFLDRLVLGLDPGHATRASRYEQAQRERLRLIKEGKRDPTWLGLLERDMAQFGTELAAARCNLVGQLAGVIDQSAPFPVADLVIAGDLERALATQPVEAVVQAFRADLAARRSVDAQAGATTHGPHRSDLRVTHRARGMAAELCSTGEQKALLIALVLAHARLLAGRGSAPLLLLDEVAAHLDRQRRTALFDALDGLPGQVWLTGTDDDLFLPLADRAQRWLVENGTAIPI
jgi:DNA replication and repair protein RecF